MGTKDESMMDGAKLYVQIGDEEYELKLPIPGFSFDQFCMSNNYRKLHGLPMRRKKHVKNLFVSMPFCLQICNHG